MAQTKTYRDANTGIVREYPTSLALSFPNLIEVEDEAPCYTCGADEGDAPTTPDDAPDSYLEWDEDDAPLEEED